MRINLLPVILGIVFAIITLNIFIQLQSNPSTKANVKSLNTESNKEPPITAKYSPYTNENAAYKDFESLVSIIKETHGEYAFYIKNLKTEKVYSYNDNERFYGASLYKVPIAMAVIDEITNKNLSYDTKITYTPNDFTDGSGTITKSEYNTKYSVLELLNLLLKESDNTAQLMLKRKLNEQSIQNAFSNLIVTENDNQSFYLDNMVTAREVGQMFERLPNEILNIMTKTSFDNRIQRGMNSDTVFAHKIGSWGTEGTWHDCGVILDNNLQPGTLVCLLSKNTTFTDFNNVAYFIGQFSEKINLSNSLSK